MKLEFPEVILLLGGCVVGALVGAAFGFIQTAAQDRYRRLQESGRLHNAATIIPGSMRRIALLLVALVTIQIAFPMLFAKEGMQWLVSAGIVIGYGWTLVRQAPRRQLYRS